MQEDIKRYSDRQRIEKGVTIRVGVNSGEMVLRSIHKDDLHTDYVPIGHSVNLAARIEGLATPGSIAVAESTYRMTQGYFRFRELGPIAVKGVSEPIRVYELEGVGALRAYEKTRATRRAPPCRMPGSSPNPFASAKRRRSDTHSRSPPMTNLSGLAQLVVTDASSLINEV
jgi:hypothetical protein